MTAPDAEEPHHFRIILEIDVPGGARPADVQGAIEAAAGLASVGLGATGRGLDHSGGVTLGEGKSAGTRVTFRVVP